MKKITVLLILMLVYNSFAVSATSVEGVDRLPNDGINGNMKKITSFDYHNFDNYGLQDIEKKVGKSIDKSQMYDVFKEKVSDELVVKKVFLDKLSIITYECADLVSYLEKCTSINSIECITDSNTSRFVIDYNTSYERIIVEYYSNGQVTKTIMDTNTGNIVLVNNSLEMIEYSKDSITPIIWELSKDEEKLIYDQINNGTIEQNKNIQTEKDSSGNISINAPTIDTDLNQFINNKVLMKNINLTSKMGISATAKKSMTTLTNSFPMYTKTVDLTKTAYSAALKSKKFVDCNVYAKTKKTRNNYIQVKYDYKTFAINTSFSIIALFLGGGVGLVQQICYYSAIAWSTVGTISSIREIAEIARDAEYTYYGAKEGYVFDKTTYNKDVKVYNNSNKGTFDGGYNSSGKWTWIESPAALALSVNSTTILDKTISYYNQCIQLYGYCALYIPD